MNPTRIKLLHFGDYLVVFFLDSDNWRVAQVFRTIPGILEAEHANINNLPWAARLTVAEIIGDPLP